MREPKFKIGQLVYLVDDVNYYIANHNGKYDTLGNQKPKSMMICYIIIDICDGGEQITYKFTNSSGPQIPEIALTSELPKLSKI